MIWAYWEKIIQFTLGWLGCLVHKQFQPILIHMKVYFFKKNCKHACMDCLPISSPRVDPLQLSLIRNSQATLLLLLSLWFIIFSYSQQGMSKQPIHACQHQINIIITTKEFQVANLFSIIIIFYIFPTS